VTHPLARLSKYLRKVLPIGPYTPKHWLDTDRRGEWLLPVCVALCMAAVYVPLFLLFLRLGRTP
jgi:hypothetical protein